ncbi:MAG: hypothetical protein KatS3mg002_0040 [Candidatus Woesearchaeota archaeon]|nr:MAG: hypothetical protein KatS3mg002_0040 [Candidatus Woesearchaeota archaeon]
MSKEINVKDIASTIINEGYMIGKNNAVNIDSKCEALEIYTRKKPIYLFGLKINKKPEHIGTLYFKTNYSIKNKIKEKTLEDLENNNEIENSNKNIWYFDNNKIGKPVIELAKKLEKKYDIQVILNDEYEVVWGKDDPGI